jgi:hypothetical protein
MTAGTPLNELFQFDDACNYRGCLEAKRKGDAFFWRVDCDVHDQQWQPIPQFLYEALKRYADESGGQSKRAVQ